MFLGEFLCLPVDVYSMPRERVILSFIFFWSGILAFSHVIKLLRSQSVFFHPHRSTEPLTVFILKTVNKFRSRILNLYCLCDCVCKSKIYNCVCTSRVQIILLHVTKNTLILKIPWFFSTWIVFFGKNDCLSRKKINTLFTGFGRSGRGQPELS